ncbi:MAG TPA: sigma-54 dependent transcriptional regulator [Blastocatellia bacterium]|nr:sigma-54 dependent transcriptional regulator [Blastocatellia bacterium]
MRKTTKKETHKLLIVEDDAHLRDTLAAFLARCGYEVATAHDGCEALELLDKELPDLVLTDIHMSGMDGLELLAEIKARYPGTVVIMMTAFSSIDTAVEAMRRGAEDYLSKPLQLADAQMSVERALERRSLRTRVAQLETQAQERYQFSQIIGKSPAMQRIYQIVERVAPTNATVLISGRTGTGKELIARAIHFNSPRAKKPLVDINCGALPEQLVESELFGHVKGAFTGAGESKKGLFEAAHEGTLFLDEVQSLKPDLQAKLLRALQERVIRRVGGRENIEVDVRVIAATNTNIAEAVKKGEFREDLYYRLNVVNIYLPDLRDRREDIPLLVAHFCQRAAREIIVTDEAMELLCAYEWPGNVRELESVIQQFITFPGRFVFREDVLRHINVANPQQRKANLPFWSAMSSLRRDEWPTIRDLRNWYVTQAYLYFGQESVVARYLGMDARTVSTILEEVAESNESLRGVIDSGDKE